MRLHQLALFGLLALSIAPAQARPSGLSVAGDMADIATRVCLGLASGELSLRVRGVDEEQEAIERIGLVYGVPAGVLDTLGRAGQTMVAQATLASRPNGANQIVFAAGGRVEGCKIILAGPAGLAVADEVTRELSGGRAGWTAAPALTTVRGPVERRSFFRRDRLGRPYLLDMYIARPAEPYFRVMTRIIPVPPGMPLPPGF